MLYQVHNNYEERYRYLIIFMVLRAANPRRVSRFRSAVVKITTNRLLRFCRYGSVCELRRTICAAIMQYHYRYISRTVIGIRADARRNRLQGLGKILHPSASMYNATASLNMRYLPGHTNCQLRIIDRLNVQAYSYTNLQAANYRHTIVSAASFYQSI